MISFTTKLDLICVKSGIKYVFSHNYTIIKVDHTIFCQEKKH